MATTRYLKNTQTEPGTTGTPTALGSVLDLSTTQGSQTTLDSGALGGSASYDTVPAKSWTMTVGASVIADGTQDYDYSWQVTASTDELFAKPRLRRVNSSGVTQATSGFGTEVAANGGDIVGIHTGTISFNAGTWAAGDRIVFDIHAFDDGPGTQTITFAVNDADSWVETVDAAGGGTFTGSSAVSVGAATCAGSATSSDPIYSGAAAVTVGETVCNGAASTDEIRTAIGAVTVGAATCAGVATFTAPVPNEELINRAAFFADLTRYRGAAIIGGDVRLAIERAGGTVITPTAFAPSASTHRSNYYYDVSVNALYRKVVTARGPGYIIAHWHRVSE